MKSSIVKHKYFKRMYVSILILAPPETFSDFLSAHAMAERTHVPSIVGKKWEPRNLVPSRFLGQIRKVEARLGKLAKIRKVETN